MTLDEVNYNQTYEAKLISCFLKQNLDPFVLSDQKLDCLNNKLRNRIKISV